MRGGQRVGSEVKGPPLDDVDYILLVNRGNEVNPGVYSDIWPGTLDKPLPILPIPLDLPDPDVLLDMNATILQFMNELHTSGASITNSLCRHQHCDLLWQSGLKPILIQLNLLHMV